ncbi:MAG: tyrosine-type recombinase/integrase [Lachnospiraceae bacterium]|nr:tyrosine-type recombinase/integrase [Lachnospiraceae bacterium]
MQQYNENTCIVIDYLATQGRGRDTVNAYKDCYQSLGEALQQTKVSYSSEYACLWLEKESGNLKKTKYDLYRAALHKLDDVYQTGDIQYDIFNPQKTKEGRLSPCFKELVGRFTAANNALAPETCRDKRYGAINILYQFQMMGCNDISDISYEVLFNYCSTLVAHTYYVKAQIHSQLNSLLCFLYSEGLVPYGYTLFVTGITMRKIRFWDTVSLNVTSRWKAEQVSAENVIPLEEYLSAGNAVYEAHENNGYSSGCLTTILQAVNLFYLFMDVNSLRYMPAQGIAWAESLKTSVSASEVSAIRRVMIMVGEVSEGMPLNLKTVFSKRITALQALPDWCSGYVREFLDEKKAENMALSSIRMMASSCCRFCFFLMRAGLSSFSQLTSQHVKQFNLDDEHKTPAGKNAYNSRIRKFLIFLAERNALSNPFLFLALPSVSAPKETIVVVLTKQEQEKLRNLFENDGIGVTLRQKAMLQLGLYMGLRGVDIINLVIGDIDWDDVSIRFVQEKTGYELYLPMPAEVANTLYRYIVRERPESSNPKVFLRGRAPYCGLETTTACTDALEAALPGRNVKGSGFHVTRKTFATNKLRSGANPDEVKEMLGHRDRANVHKYLSLDEERMRLCCMDLSERSLQMEGGFGR